MIRCLVLQSKGHVERAKSGSKVDLEEALAFESQRAGHVKIIGKSPDTSRVIFDHRRAPELKSRGR